MLVGKSEKKKSIVLGVLPQPWEKLLKSHTHHVKKNTLFSNMGGLQSLSEMCQSQLRWSSLFFERLLRFS